MSKIEWDDSLNLGIKAIDDQHKLLIEIANELLLAIHHGLASAEMNNIFNRLREYTVVHFIAEEQYMSDIGYVGLGRHQQEHMNLKRLVKEYQQRLYRKENVDAYEVRDFMRAWLVDHIIKSDMEIARFLKKTTEVEAKLVTVEEAT